MSPPPAEPIYALLDYEDPYVQPLILAAFKSRLNHGSYKLISSLTEYPSEKYPLLQFRAYESLDFELASHKSNCLMNAYVIRKALIRKHYLSTTVSNWVAKHPQSVLSRHFKPAVDFELDYAEFLDDALVEAFELRESFKQNESKDPADREWWILKPGMSDRGQGIRLFSTEEELTSIFEGWEAEQPESDGEEQTRSDDEEATDTGNTRGNSDYIITSQLRYFLAQPYIHPPLLFPACGNRKFHIRTYVLAAGSLRVFVYKHMLALFAAEAYVSPWESGDLRTHLTNTCLQETGEREGSVQAFWSLPDDLPIDSKPPATHDLSETNGTHPSENWKAHVFDQICAVTGEAFEAAARGMMVHFQPLPNAFELYGLDFLVDAAGTAWLLEVNAFPDFKQTGNDLKDLIQSLFNDVVDVAIKPFYGIDHDAANGTARMRKVLDIDLGRR